MRHASARAAFSLLDTLIAVSVITLLVALSLPVIASARLAAADLKSIANMRSHAQVFGLYANDWDDAFPQFADPAADFSVVRDRQVAIVFEYFQAVVWWPIALSDGYYDSAATASDDLFLHDLTDPDRFNIYYFSSSLMAAPAYWNRETRSGDRSQWGGCRVTQVSFPSAKAQLWEWHPTRPLPIATEAYVREVEGVGLALVDGSAGRHHTRDLVPPYPFGDGTIPGTYQPIGFFGLHTVNGWLGRDVK